MYVLGDDYSGRSIRRVLNVVENLNQSGFGGDTLVRIHGIGFPVHLRRAPSLNSSAVRYANLMRQLAEENNGTFIGLNNVR